MTRAFQELVKGSIAFALATAAELTIAGGNVVPVKACILSLCAGDQKTSERDVVRKLGRGMSVRRPDDAGPTRCYFDSANNVWGDFTFVGRERQGRKDSLESIFLSSQPLCDPSTSKSTAPLNGSLLGVSLGMSEADVVSKLGKPVRTDDSKDRERRKPQMAETRYAAKFGETVLVYSNESDLGTLMVFLENGKTKSIWFTASD